MTSTSTAQRRRWLALVLLSLAQFVVVLDASIVNVALPSIQRDLGFSDSSLQWVVNAYVLTFGGFLLLGGRAADLFGRRRIFIGGLILFSLASLAGGLATSEGWLVAARAVQGLGAAIVSPAALSIITVTFQEGTERNKALGVWGAVAGAGGAVGVLLGGVLTDSLGWEWVLFVNVPIGLIAAMVAPTLLAESRSSEDTRRGFDVAGAVAVTLGLALLIFTVVNTTDHGWGSLRTVLGLAGALALLVAFVVREATAHTPLIRLSIFRSRTLSGANAVGLLTGAALFAMFYFISLYLQQVLGASPLRAGIEYLPLAITIFLSAGGASTLVTRVGVRPVLVTGLLAVAGGLVWFSQVSAGGSWLADVLGPSLLVALGLGFAFVSQTLAAVAGVPDRESGLASGLINTSQQVGGALGLAVLATLATDRTAGAVAHGASQAVAATDGFQRAFLVGAAFAVAGALLALVFVRPPREALEEDAEAERVPAAA